MLPAVTLVLVVVECGAAGRVTIQSPPPQPLSQADRAAWVIPGAVDGGAVDGRALPECGGGSETGAS